MSSRVPEQEKVMKTIRSMTFDELVKMRAKIDTAIEQRLAGERRDLVKALEKLRLKANLGPTARLSPLRGRKIAPRYSNPKNSQETWTGRGRRPRWLVAALKRGKKLQAFAIS
jgi:DNA-binding protein H-NS